MATSGGNQDLLFLLGGRALRSVDDVAVYWSLQRHHPDHQRWLEVGHFPDRKLAKLALEAFVAHGQGDQADFRVKRVSEVRP